MDTHTRERPAPPQQNTGRWLVLVAMTGALAMVMLDQTVVTVALPSVTRELPLSAVGQQWVVNAYVLPMAALVALGGEAGRQARRRHHLPARRGRVLPCLRRVRSRPAR